MEESSHSSLLNRNFSSNEKDDLQDLSFEKAMAELENIVRRLEDGRLNLEDAIGAYEKGTALKNHCESKLRAARLRVEYVVKDQQVSGESEPV